MPQKCVDNKCLVPFHAFTRSVVVVVIIVDFAIAAVVPPFPSTSLIWWVAIASLMASASVRVVALAFAGAVSDVHQKQLKATTG